jgi:pimeloyl-ACP methyl ester carboxylesterase
MNLLTDLNVHVHGRPLGEAPTMLWLHGLTDSGSGWPEAVRHWEDRYAIVALDHRGHGESPRFTDDHLAGHPGDVMVDDAIAVLEQLDRPIVIGHSLGGAVAVTAAVRRPELVRALVLEDPAPLGPDEPQRSHRGREEFLAGLKESIEAPDDEALLAVRREQHPDWPESELLVTGHAEQKVDQRYLAHGDLKPTVRWPEAFAQVSVPTVVISGDRPDEVVVDEDFEKDIAAAGNPLVRLVRVQGTGHCIRRENPSEYYRLVDDFLTKLGSF